MSIIDRIKSRQAVTPVLTVSWDKFVFQIARFAEAEMINARTRARERLRNEGIDPNAAAQSEMTVAICIVLPDVLRRHVKTWDCAHLEFTKANLEALFNEMTEEDRIGLSLAYLTAAEEDKQKKTQTTPIPSSAPGVG